MVSGEKFLEVQGVKTAISHCMVLRISQFYDAFKKASGEKLLKCLGQCMV